MEEEYSPYCELCEACGEDGCCSHINCFSALIKNPKCKYGEIYIKEAILNNQTVKMIFELIENLKNNNNYTKEMFVNDFDLEYDKLLDIRYSKD
jgi:hypothetical protein